MNLFDENSEMIVILENMIEQLKISEIESFLESENVDKNYNKIIMNGHENLLKMKNRVYAVNEKIIIDNPDVRFRFQNIQNFASVPCGIEYMDLISNSCDYWAISFYSELFNKYQKEPIKLITLGMMYGVNGRLLKLEYLEKEDKTRAELLNQYLNLKAIRTQMEMLIDGIKCIQFNYIGDNRVS